MQGFSLLADMEKQFFIDRTETIIRAASTCPELKSAAEAWMASIGSENERDMAEAYIAELEEDVTPIEKLIELLESEKGPQLFGELQAKRMLKKAHDVDDLGMKYCICASCNAGGAILDNKEKFLELI